jgi:hypothetical protein
MFLFCWCHEAPAHSSAGASLYDSHVQPISLTFNTFNDDKLRLPISTAKNRRGTMQKNLMVLLCVATDKLVPLSSQTSVSFVSQMEPGVFDWRVVPLALCLLWDSTRTAPFYRLVGSVTGPRRWGSCLGRSYSTIESVVVCLSVCSLRRLSRFL